MVALRQQLQQSGLWEALPRILSSAAHKLEQCAAEPAQLAAMQQSGDEPVQPQGLLLVYVGDLFILQQALVRLWDASSLLQSPLLASAEATMQLAAAAVQFMCSYQEQPQALSAQDTGELVICGLERLLLNLRP